MKAGIAALAVAGLVAAPWLLDVYAITILTKVLVLGLVAMCVNLLTGITGLPTLGQAAYLGVGAYAAALLARGTGAVGVVQIVVAAAVGAAFAALTGLVVTRARGVTFLMLTFAVGELAISAAVEWDNITNGTDGLTVPPLVPVWGMNPVRLDGYVYLYVLAVFLILFAGVTALVRSPFGLTLSGVRENEARLRASGYPVGRFLLAGYTIAGAVSGAAGALWVQTQRSVSPTDLGFHVSAMVLIAVILGGVGSMWGAVAGMALVVFTRDYLGGQLEGDLSGRGQLLLGILFVLAVYLIPRGLSGLAARLTRRRPPVEASS